MKVEQLSDDVVRLTAARHEPAALAAAAARMAHQLLKEDPGGPAEARARLGHVLAAFDAALQRHPKR